MSKEPTITPIEQIFLEIESFDTLPEVKKVLKDLLMAELSHPDSKSWWYMEEYEKIINLNL